MPVRQELNSREANMVCILCNGKGYIVEKNREMPCPECQGRGENMIFEGGGPPNFGSPECYIPPCFGDLHG